MALTKQKDDLMKKREDIWKDLGMTFKDYNWYDPKGRLVLREKGNTLVIARVPDMDPEIKKEIACFFCVNTGTKIQKVYDFLNYQEEEEAFCS